MFTVKLSRNLVAYSLLFAGLILLPWLVRGSVASAQNELIQLRLVRGLGTEEIELPAPP